MKIKKILISYDFQVLLLNLVNHDYGTIYLIGYKSRILLLIARKEEIS